MGCCCTTFPACGCERFTQLGDLDLRRTLGQCLVPLADSIRDLNTSFGLRPYKVRIIRTRWTQGTRGRGEEVVTWEQAILPTPLISDLTALQLTLNPVGADELGGITLTEVSGRYTEDNLRGVAFDGTGPGPDEQVYWEVEFPRLDGQHGERRRFVLRSAPTYKSDEFQWELRLEKAVENRSRAGDPR